MKNDAITPLTPAQQVALVQILKTAGFWNAKTYHNGTVTLVSSGIYTGEYEAIKKVEQDHALLVWLTPTKGGIRATFLRQDEKEPVNL